MPGNKDAFDAVIKNYGKLTIDGVTINAKNLYATDFAIINEGNLVLKEGAVLDLIKASAIAGEGEVTDETAE